MKRTLLLLPVLLAAPAFCADEINLADLLPSDTQIVFGIRVRTVVDSELARHLTTQMKGQAADWEKLIAASGFDPLHDLDEVLIASTGAGKKAPTLIVARGRFDVAKLAPNAEQYRGVPLVENKTGPASGVFGFLGGSTALAGDPDMVRAAIDRRGEVAHMDAALAAQVAEYRGRYDVWAVVNRTDGLAGYVPTDNSPAAALNSIDHFQFGVSVKKGLELTAEVHARSDKDAEQLSATLQFLEAMSKAAQPTGSQGTKFAFKNDGGTLKVSLSVSEEDLKKAIENQGKAGMLLATRPMPARPAKPVVTAPVEPAPVPLVAQQAAPEIPVAPPAAAESPVAPGAAMPAAVPTPAPAPAPVTAPAEVAAVAAAAPSAAPAPRKTVAPGNGPDTSSTAVFTLPGKP
jgi:hypothetical protein